jgi:hypothetical protein
VDAERISQVGSSWRSARRQRRHIGAGQGQSGRVGETARSRTVSTIEEPTAQEAPIARVLGYSSLGDALR